MDGGVDGLLQQLVCSAKKAIKEAGVDRNLLLGMGVDGSGVVDSRQGTLDFSSTINFLRDVPLARIFVKEFGLTTGVENITRAKAIAERLLGAEEMAEDMIYVEYGRTGIGAGIIIDGNLFHGSGFAAGELGQTHMIEDAQLQVR